MTKIDWCINPDGTKGITWNPVHGCKNGCEYCYAEKIFNRFIRCEESPSFKNPYFVDKNYNKLFPKKPSTIFVNSMSDIEYWQPEWMQKVLNKIKDYPQHRFLFLTKNPSIYDQYKWPVNCWLGVTITNQKQMDRLNNEFQDYVWPAHYNFFLSAEPLLEEIDLYIIPDWLIIGAESGNRKGKVIPEKKWIKKIVRIAKEDEDMECAIFMKESLRQIMGADFIQQIPWEVKA